MTEKFFGEYLDLYEFMGDAEKEFRKCPFTFQLNRGMLYKGGKQDVYIVVSAVKTKEEALSLVNKKTILEMLRDIRTEVMGSQSMLENNRYDFLRIIDSYIYSIENDKHRGCFEDSKYE